MKPWIYILCVSVTFLLYTLIYVGKKKKKPLKRAFLVMLFGIVVMICVDAAAKFTGVYIPISPFSLAVSSCFGVPGVAAMLVISWAL